MKDIGAYTAQKDKVMKGATANFISDLRSKLNSLEYKYVNNTKEFDSELEYLMFCRAQIKATVLKMISLELEIENS